ncbi:DUF2628 domain-containing protein (plasmid) [Paucilactobacillus suebicus]|nr:hypothetical protein [Paucilactobacillus suebicus]
MMINLTNSQTSHFKQVKVGFSWTTFFFGCLPALFRGDWKWFFIIALIEIIFGIPTIGFGAGIIGIIFSFIYNKLYINDLLSNGYVAADEASNRILQSRGFTINK